MAVLSRTTIAAPVVAHPLRFSDSFRAALESYATAGDKVSAALLDPLATHLDFADCLALREDFTISYLPKGKIGEQEVGGWKWKNRQSGRPAKVARAVLMPWYIETFLTDADFETFANKVRGVTVEVAGSPDEEVSLYGIVKLVRGEEIRHWYNGANNQVGAIGSCMTYANCQPWFDIYCKNSNVGLLVVIKNKLAVGRALVWTTTDGKTVLDRIYANTGPAEAMRAYAKKRGWSSDAYHSSTQHTVQLEHTVFKSYPYIDSFRYVDHKRKLLFNSQSCDHYDQSLGYGDGGPHVNFSCWSCKTAFTDGDKLTLNAHGAYCAACLAKHECVRCKTFDLDQKAGMCAACVAVRTCAYCAEIDRERDLKRDACSACAKLSRTERERVKTDRLEALRVREERKARRIELRQTREANRAGLRARIDRGPKNLQTAWAISYVPTQDVFLEHIPDTYAAYDDSGLRRLIEEIDHVCRRVYVDNFAEVEAGVLNTTDLIGPVLAQRLRADAANRRANVVP